MAKNKLTLAGQMALVSENYNYVKIIKQIKDAAKLGKRKINVTKINLPESDLNRILFGGFTVEQAENLGYAAFIISW